MNSGLGQIASGVFHTRFTSHSSPLHTGHHTSGVRSHDLLKAGMKSGFYGRSSASRRADIDQKYVHLYRTTKNKRMFITVKKNDLGRYLKKVLKVLNQKISDPSS